MSYINKISYQIYKVEKKPYRQMLDELFSHLDVKQAVLRIVLFGEVVSKDDYMWRLAQFRRKAEEYFQDALPVVTFVAQKPLDAELVLEIHGYMSERNDRLEYKSYGGFPYVVLTNECGRFLYAGGVCVSFDSDIYTQSKEVFRVLECILNREKFSVGSIVRQWNYIDGITAFDNNGDQHYQMFNNARSEFYLSDTWKNGYPAATGIGTRGGGVIVDIDAAMAKEVSFSILPIDNELQVAAYSYSGSVLEKADTGKTTPKFERAKSLQTGDCCMMYLSGTAAIRGEVSLAEADVVAQLRITLENIRHLIGDVSMKLLRVYLKNESDYNKVHDSLEREGVCISYLLADVCRDELLIEIEGIAWCSFGRE